MAESIEKKKVNSIIINELKWKLQEQPLQSMWKVNMWKVFTNEEEIKKNQQKKRQRTWINNSKQKNANDQ